MQLVFLNKDIAHIFKRNSVLMTYLETQHIELFEMPHLLSVDARVSGHVDLGLYTENDLIILEPNLYELMGRELQAVIGACNEQSKEIKVIKGSQGLNKAYPHDARYNILNVGQQSFHRLDITDKQILRHSKRHFVHMSQGYARCSTLPVGDHAAITSDLGVAKVLRAYGIEVLLIKEGHIKLEGFKNGFIGGVGGSVGSLMLLAGELKYHPDGELIQAFIMDTGFQMIELFNGPLLDIGSILSYNMR